jgi:predicted GIY-YIG superfamily endonuclease
VTDDSHDALATALLGGGLGEPNMLYRFFYADDQLLYVGITANPGARWTYHSRKKAGWRQVVRATIEHFDSRDEVIKAEIIVIQTERPLWNVLYNLGGQRDPSSRGVNPRVSAGQRSLSEIEDSIRAGDWPYASEVRRLFATSREKFKTGLESGFEMGSRRLVIRYRLDPGGLPSYHPGDALAVLAELRKVRSAEYPDGIPDQE